MKNVWSRPALALTLFGAGIAVVACGGDDGPPQPTATIADAVFTNGKVVTVDEKFSIAQAFAVKDGAFIAVGTTSDIQKNIGPTTQVVDLNGRTVIPGLGDMHFHGAGGGPGIDLSKTRTMAQFLAKITEAAQKAAPGTILVSNPDWHEAQLAEQRVPLAEELEAAAPGYPVVVVRGGHSYFLNNTALAKWNITASTPVPAGGAIGKDANGKLTGELDDTAKSLVQLPPAPPITLDNIVAEQKVVNSYGLTQVRVPGTSAAAFKQYQQLVEQKRSTLRYSVLFRDTAANVEAAGIKPTDGDDWVKVWGLKMGVDGGFEGGYMTAPYAEPYGQGGTFYGTQTITQSAFNAAVVAANQAGWRVATHTVGDAALDEVLNGYEAANAVKNIRGKGWTIEHAFISRKDQYPRMKNLDLRLSVQDHLYLVAPTLKAYWGAERASQVTPIKTYLDEGFLMASGTDAYVIPLNPFWVLYHWITRDSITGGVMGANQAVSREDALRMSTINYAKLIDESARKGSIEPNKLADFVVISADYLTIPAAQVEDLKALATYVDGKKVYQDPDVQI